MIFANQAALALENALMYEELKAFSSQLEERVKKATRELEETQRQLLRSEKLATLGQPSVGIAHEIRNPLTNIKILIHSLVDPEATEASSERDLAVIEAEIARVNKIIKQFLDFARPRPPALVMAKGPALLADDFLLEEKNILEAQRQTELENKLYLLMDPVFKELKELARSSPQTDLISTIEKILIKKALAETKGNQVQAAVLLGINRNTLRSKMERYKIKKNITISEEE